jgi:oligoribonuclease (3'-5' exoribonuclease)
VRAMDDDTLFYRGLDVVSTARSLAVRWLSKILAIIYKGKIDRAQ